MTEQILSTADDEAIAGLIENPADYVERPYREIFHLTDSERERLWIEVARRRL